MTIPTLDPAYLRDQIVGVDSTFDTPFGQRLMVYCDYTASGRCLRFVESYLQSLQRVYANTHTEDDITGRSMSQLLHEAEEAIKASVNAGPHGQYHCLRHRCNRGYRQAPADHRRVPCRPRHGKICRRSFQRSGQSTRTHSTLPCANISRSSSSGRTSIIPTKFRGASAWQKR